MDKMSEVELLLILGFYYVGKEKNIERFTTLFNLYFGKDLSTQMILHEVSRFRNADPANNVGGASRGTRYQDLWNEYIAKDKISELKELYSSFIGQRFTELVNSHPKREYKHEEKTISYKVHDEPKILAGTIEKRGEEYQRDHTVIENALYASGYTCEGMCGCDLFIRQDGKNNYTEGHHLIPLSFQPLFEYSLDVEANVVSLCPRCHRLLHYGQEKSQLLLTLYEKRIARLRMCGIAISYEKLLLLYSGARADEKDE